MTFPSASLDPSIDPAPLSSVGGGAGGERVPAGKWPGACSPRVSHRWRRPLDLQDIMVGITIDAFHGEDAPVEVGDMPYVGDEENGTLDRVVGRESGKRSRRLRAAIAPPIPSHIPAVCAEATGFPFVGGRLDEASEGGEAGRSRTIETEDSRSASPASAARQRRRGRSAKASPLARQSVSQA